MLSLLFISYEFVNRFLEMIFLCHLLLEEVTLRDHFSPSSVCPSVCPPVLRPLREGTCVAVGTIDPLFSFFNVAKIGFYVVKRTKE